MAKSQQLFPFFRKMIHPNLPAFPGFYPDEGEDGEGFFFFRAVVIVDSGEASLEGGIFAQGFDFDVFELPAVGRAEFGPVVGEGRSAYYFHMIAYHDAVFGIEGADLGEFAGLKYCLHFAVFGQDFCFYIGIGSQFGRTGKHKIGQQAKQQVHQYPHGNIPMFFNHLALSKAYPLQI